MSLPPAHPAQGVVVLLGPARSRWPEPLATAIELGDLHLETVASLHEAAALIAEHRTLVRALLLDPAILSAGTLPGLKVLKSRLSMPLVMLPVTHAASPAVHHAMDAGVLSWEHADRVLAPVHTPAPDNVTSAPDAIPDDLKVSSATEPRYDEHQPVLTDEELRALLGTP